MSYTAPGANALWFNLAAGYSPPDGNSLQFVVGDAVPTTRIAGASSVALSSSGPYDAIISWQSSASVNFIPRDHYAELSISGSSVFAGVNPDRALSFISSSTFSPVGGGLASSSFSAQGASSSEFIGAVEFSFACSTTTGFAGESIACSSLNSTGSARASWNAIFNKDVQAKVFGKAVFSGVGISINQAGFGVSGSSVFAPVMRAVNDSALSASPGSAASMNGAAVCQSDAAINAVSSMSVNGELVNQGSLSLAGMSGALFYGAVRTIQVTQVDESADTIFVLSRTYRIDCHA